MLVLPCARQRAQAHLQGVSPMTKQVYVDEIGRAKLNLRNAFGHNVGDVRDMKNIEWQMSHEDCVSLVDDGAEPSQARFQFTEVSPADEEVWIGAKVTGDLGEGSKEIAIGSERFVIVRPLKSYLAGEQMIEFTQIDPVEYENTVREMQEAAEERKRVKAEKESASASASERKTSSSTRATRSQHSEPAVDLRSGGSGGQGAQ
jgi:hypothetical protein